MPIPAPIKNVQSDEVGTVVQDFIDDDVKRLEVKKQSDGTFTVIPLPLD
ncbi:MAG: hypothetical protein MRK02_12615 [Candidatus Scalindua sp.]|nr:hypothetical protein [Candidatus Scalindua sp.]